MAAPMVSLDQMIVMTPGTAGGRPRINGTGVTVARIALLVTAEGLTPQQIVDGVFPRLTLGQIHAALAFYHLNRDAIDAQIAEDNAEYERARAKYGRASRHAS